MTTVADVARTLEDYNNRDFVYRVRLFVESFGDKPIGEVTILDVLGYRERVVREYEPWTAVGYLAAAKKVVRWAASVGLRGPIDLAAVPPVKVGPPKDKAWSVAEVRKLMVVAEVSDRRAWAYMRLQYLACLRPSEVLTVVNGGYQDVGDCLITLTSHKTAHMGQPRYVVLSEHARVALLEARSAVGKRAGRSKTARPWATPNSYANACAKATGGRRPHQLRHSAATSLLGKGVDRREVDLLLGHSVGNRVSLTYMKVLEREYEALLPRVRLLALDLPNSAMS